MMGSGKMINNFPTNEAVKDDDIILWFNNFWMIFNFCYKFMSFLYFGNTPASVPPVFDTTPCMKEMLNYEDCVYE